MTALYSLLTLVIFTATCWIPLWPMLYPRDHPRYVSPVQLFDVPNTTYHGGLI